MNTPDETTIDAPSKAPRDFFEAARFGMVSKLQGHLESGIDVNAIDPRTKGTVLHHVAASGSEEALDAIVATGKADYLARDRFGRLAFEICDDRAFRKRLLALHAEQARSEGVRLRFRPRNG